MKLPAIIGDHMVLQRDTEVKLWGWSTPETPVTVHIGPHRVSVMANQAGDWHVIIPPLRTHRSYDMTVTSGDETLAANNILMGEVWICSGQSNMEWSVARSNNPDEEIADA